LFFRLAHQWAIGGGGFPQASSAFCHEDEWTFVGLYDRTWCIGDQIEGRGIILTSQRRSKMSRSLAVEGNLGWYWLEVHSHRVSCICRGFGACPEGKTELAQHAAIRRLSMISGKSARQI
jgi:hypothetical protein